MASKNTPKDAQVMATILKESGITEYEPRVLNQMLEFTYRYVTNVLDDAKLLSSHAKKKSIDIDDVRLAIELQKDKYFTTPPLREVLVEIAAQKNSTPLPLIKATAGPRLPPDRYNLTACNYKLKPSKKQRLLPSVSRSVTTLQSPAVNKLSPQVTLNNKSAAALSVVTKAGSSTVPVLPRTMPNPGLTRSLPAPIIKLTEGTRTTGAPTTIVSSMPTPQIITKRDPVPELGEKRKREDGQEDGDA